MAKKQSIKSRYHESAGEERAEHGYHKPKNKKKSFEKFEKKERIKKAMKHKDVLGEGAKKRKHLKNPKEKVEVVMKEFKRGTLRSGSGAHVENPKQAIAIGLSEARKAGAHIPKKRGKMAKRARSAMKKKK